MHGQNPIRKAEHCEDGALQVREIFGTIQGEGPYAGHPATFIRLTGCNLKCHFCDTEWDDANDPTRSVDHIVDEILAITPAYIHLVVITGGEPLRQNLRPLVDTLIRQRPSLKIQIETAGTLWQDVLWWTDLVKTVVSPKTPKIHTFIAEIACAYKYVVRHNELSPDDGLPVFSTQVAGAQARLARPTQTGIPVYLSPCDEGDPEKNQANLLAVVQSARRYGYIAGIQLHKYLGLA
jgi:7-carboxy-7-deazaguanine synthase